MRTETLYIGTREEILDSVKHKTCPGQHTIEDQLNQYSHEYPKNFGCLFYHDMNGGIAKKFFLMTDD